MKIQISPGKVAKQLLYFLFFLFILNTLGILLKQYAQLEIFKDMVQLFNFNEEKSIPTFFSIINLTTTSILLFLIFNIKQRVNSKTSFYWLGLSAIFLFIAIDESLQIHEKLGILLGANFKERSGYLFYVWVVPYAILVVTFLCFYLQFILNLPSRTRNLFIFAGAVFCAGALGCEILGGKIASEEGVENLAYAFFYTTEETLEILGIIIMNYAIMDYIATSTKEFKVKLKVHSDLKTKSPSWTLDKGLEKSRRARV